MYCLIFTKSGVDQRFKGGLWRWIGKEIMRRGKVKKRAKSSDLENQEWEYSGSDERFMDAMELRILFGSWHIIPKRPSVLIWKTADAPGACYDSEECLIIMQWELEGQHTQKIPNNRPHNTNLLSSGGKFYGRVINCDCDGDWRLASA